MRFRPTTAVWMLISALTISATSCSSQQALNTVQGKVMLKDQPLAGATVMFHSESGERVGNDWPVAITSSDGSFSLKTGEQAGAAEGKYKVSIVCMEASTGKGEGMAMGEEVDRLKGAYADPKTSKFSVEVKAGANQLEPFVLE